MTQYDNIRIRVIVCNLWCDKCFLSDVCQFIQELATTKAEQTATRCFTDSNQITQCRVSAAYGTAIRIKANLEVTVTGNVAAGLSLVPGTIMLQVELDGSQQQQVPITTAALSLEKHDGTRLRLALGGQLSAMVKNTFHRGWQRFRDGTLLLVVSKSNDTEMTLEQCMVSFQREDRENLSFVSQGFLFEGVALSG